MAQPAAIGMRWGRRNQVSSWVRAAGGWGGGGEGLGGLEINLEMGRKTLLRPAAHLVRQFVQQLFSCYKPPVISSLKASHSQ